MRRGCDSSAPFSFTLTASVPRFRHLPELVSHVSGKFARPIPAGGWKHHEIAKSQLGIQHAIRVRYSMNHPDDVGGGVMRRLTQVLFALLMLSSAVAEVPTEMPIPEAFGGSPLGTASL
jgi:hypothetical protein